MRQGGYGWLFLALMLMALTATNWLAPDAAVGSAKLFVKLLLKVAPALGLVLLLQFLLSLCADRAWIRRRLGRDSGLAGWLVAIGAGVLATGPIYAWYAFAGELKSEGVRPGLVAAFLYALGVKLPLLPLLMHYFGLAYAMALTTWMIVFALVCGLIVERVQRRPSDAV